MGVRMEKTKNGKNRDLLLRIRYFLRYFIVLTILFFILAFIYLWIDRESHFHEHKSLAKTQLEYQVRVIRNHFLSVRSDLLFLPRLNEMLRYKELEDDSVRQLLEKEFLEFVRSRRYYDQLRYIGRDGIEICRVNYNKGFPAIVPLRDLQDKSRRYYFTETMELEEGDIYISPFDLNVEKGVIEQPLKPMIRLGTPVFNSRGEVDGVMVLNLLGVLILNDLKEASRAYDGTFVLLNSEGYWLYSENPVDEWGFMFSDRMDLTFQNRYPEVWEQISRNSSTQILTDTHLVTSHMIDPFSVIGTGGEGRHWILLSILTQEDMHTGMGELFRTLFRVMLYISVVIILLSYLLAETRFQKEGLQNALTRSALYDSLTGLPNRILFSDRALLEQEHADRYSRLMALFFIDLDGFKKVNDTLGHEAGDLLLRQAADRMVSCVRKSDTVARFGGDEFIVLLSEIENPGDCGIAAENILRRLSEDFDLEGKVGRIGASIGMAVYSPGSGDTIEGLLRNADSAMYEVKKSGKNNYRMWTDSGEPTLS